MCVRACVWCGCKAKAVDDTTSAGPVCCTSFRWRLRPEHRRLHTTGPAHARGVVCLGPDFQVNYALRKISAEDFYLIFPPFGSHPWCVWRSRGGGETWLDPGNNQTIRLAKLQCYGLTEKASFVELLVEI